MMIIIQRVAAMVRYSTEHKENTRQSILCEAAGELRRSGPDKVSVAALMKKAGLTHGGFYAHFASKDVLIAEAVAWAFADRLQFFNHMLQKYPEGERLARYIDAYLSPAHRNEPGKGCPVPALAADISRCSADIQARYQEGLDNMLALFASAIPAPAVQPLVDDRMDISEQDRRLHLARSALSEMAGAVVLARGMPDATEAEHWLASCRQSVKQRLHLQAYVH
ncbi:TetR/AcrR family transcriptional regulator [Thalassolituus sp. LLYu03]|uniref:TetR/AcrR family transcriptional regulator n=1 Tax=Thalassolituus sp. LLYu03 TaxID=3421656 RepID=UPI003D26FB1E